MDFELHRFGDDAAYHLRSLDEMFIGKVCVSGGGPMPPVPEEPTDKGQTFARHNGLADSLVP